MTAPLAIEPGRPWVVKRRWIPRLGSETLWHRFWRRSLRTRRRTGDLIDADPGCLGALGDGFLAAIALIVVVLIAVFVVIPLLVALVDVLILVVLALIALAARVLFRRPWIIDARDGSGTVLRWRVIGWRASGEQVAVIRELLAQGTVASGAEVTVDAVIADAG